MRIVFLTRLYFPHVGGVEKHVEQISGILQNKNHSITVVTEQFDSTLPVSEKINGITVHRIPLRTNGFLKKFEVWYWMLRNACIFFSSDITHCHDVFFWYLPLKFLMPHKRVYTTFHGYEGKYPVSERAKFIRKLSEKLSNGNICVGAFIRKWYGTKTQYVTYGGVVRTRDSKIKNKNITEPFNILFIGRLEPDTGVHLYIDLIKKLQTRGLNFTFKAIGKGSLSNTLSVFGTVESKPTSEQDLQWADLVFASSYLSMLEALTMGKLVVALYDNPLKKDYIQMSPFDAYVLHGSNTGSIAGKLVNIMKRRDKGIKFVDQGHEWAKEQTWVQVTGLYEQLWKK